MTSYCKFIFVILFVAANGCKKDNPQPTTPQTENKWVVTTFAGEGTGAFNDGPLLSAKFKSPTGVTVAADGALFVADMGNHRIRKISDGLVSTFAGNDTEGFINGNGLEAQFKSPYHIGSDKNGNLYILDQDISLIRKISPAADVSVFAGVVNPGVMQTGQP